MDVSFACVCPVIDHKFRNNIVKVAVDPRAIAKWIRRLRILIKSSVTEILIKTRSSVITRPFKGQKI